MNQTLASVFHLLVAGLRGVIGPLASRGRATPAFLIFLSNRLSHAALRFEKLFTRWKNGTLPKPRAATARPATAPATAPAPATAKPRKPPAFQLPSGRAWLQRALAEYEVDGCRVINGCRSQFLHVLASPEMRDFLQAAPQARRILNPFCRMLGMNLDAPYGVPLPPTPPEPAAPRRRPAPRKPPEPPPVPQPPRLNLIEFFSSS